MIGYKKQLNSECRLNNKRWADELVSVTSIMLLYVYVCVARMGEGYACMSTFAYE